MAPTFQTLDELRAAMRVHEALPLEDIKAIETLPSLYAYCFDTCNSTLAAELFCEDAVNKMLRKKKGGYATGRAAIRESFAKQERIRRKEQYQLRSRHVVSNLAIRSDPKVAGLAHGHFYLTLYRNPDSSYPMGNGPADPLFCPAAVGEYQFQCRKDSDGVWRFLEFRLDMHFSRSPGIGAGLTSSLPNSKL